MIVTKDKDDFGKQGEYFCLPLLNFLLLFD